MVTNTVLYCYTKKFAKVRNKGQKQAKVIFVWYPKEQGDLKAIREENDVLTDDEVVIARCILRESKYGCVYI